MHATHGMPPGCGNAVDLLHSFLLKPLQSSGPLVEESAGQGCELKARYSPLGLMAYGGPAGRAWQHKLQTGTLTWPLEESVWQNALDKGRGRGPMRHLKTLANQLGWHPQPGGWQADEQFFTWHEADYKVKWDSATVLLTEVAQRQLDSAGLETGLSAQPFGTLRSSKCSNKRDDRTRCAVNAALGG
eukprot:4132282-Amphidinium_carterae.1